MGTLTVSLLLLFVPIASTWRGTDDHTFNSGLERNSKECYWVFRHTYGPIGQSNTDHHYRETSTRRPGQAQHPPQYYPGTVSDPKDRGPRHFVVPAERQHQTYTDHDKTLLYKLDRELDRARYYELLSHCSLLILSPTLDDQGTWTVFNGTHTEQVLINIVDSPSTVEIWAGDKLLNSSRESQNYILPDKDDFIHVKCVARGGHPEPDHMEMTVNGQIANDTTLSVERLFNGRYSASITTKFQPDEIIDDDHRAAYERKTYGIPVTCQVTQPKGTRREHRSNRNGDKPTRAYVRVKRPLSKPVLKIREGSAHSISNSEPVVYVCCEVAQGNPPPTQFKLLIIDSYNYYQTLSTERCNEIRNTGSYYCDAGVESTEEGDEGDEDDEGKKKKKIVWSKVSAALTIPAGEPGKVYFQAEVGAALTIPCDLEVEDDECIWIHGETVLVSSNPNLFPDGYKVERNRNDGTCNLVIEHVTEEDKNRWDCASMKTQKPHTENVVYF